MKQPSAKNTDNSLSTTPDSNNSMPEVEALQQKIEILSKRIAELKQQNEKLSEENSAQDRKISWDSADINHKTKTIVQLQDLLAKQNLETTNLKRQIKQLQQSPSFRIGRAVTSPARIFKRNAPSVSSPTPEKISQSPAPADQSAYAPGVINLGAQLYAFYGKHRSGWNYAVMQLAPLNQFNGIYCDVSIERTFVWQPGEIQATRKPWIGFIHVPPNAPDWFQSEQTNNVVFSSDVWKESYPYCRGLFTLSEYHKKNLETRFDVPINSLIHPTSFPDVTWKWELFEKNANRKIVQIGWWLRKLHAIFELPESDYEKTFLNVGNHAYFKKVFNKEREIREAKGLFKESMYDTATTLSYLPDDQYDKLLSENIIFIDLYDSSANNLVIECIVRNAPLLVNPIEPVVEYLGEEYPFYFTSHEEAVQKANNLNLVRKTHDYLKNHPIKEKLTGDYFLESFKSSEIFKSL